VKGIVSIIKDALWLVVRFLKKRDAPEAVRRRDQHEIDKAVAERDADKLNVILNDELERLHDKDSGSKR
jgi:hypothetical protein